MESLLTRPQNPVDIDIEKVAKSYSDLLKFPTLSSANFQDSSSVEFLNVHTVWTTVDVIGKEKCSIVKSYSVLKSSLAGGQPIVSVTTPIPYSNVKLTCFSNTGSKKAVLCRNSAGASNGNKSEDDGEILRIFDKEMLLKVFDLKKLDKHKGVYTNSQWGSTMKWSQDGSKLAYLAEKKIPKAEPFLGSIDSSEVKASESGKGEEFAFRQNQGEQLMDCFQSVVVILDVDAEKFEILELPDKLFPSDLQWVNSSSIVGTGYVHTPWRLGLIYCTNRESRIFQIGTDGNNFRYISNSGRAAFGPRVSPDSKLLIWQERNVGGPHDKSREIMAVSIETKTHQDSPRCIYPTDTIAKIPIYQNFPSKCWGLDSKKFYVVTQNELESVLLEFSIAADFRLLGVLVVTKDVENIYDIEDKAIIASRSSTIESPQLLLINIDGMKLIEISKSHRVVTRPVCRLTLPGTVSPLSFYYGPTGDDVKKRSVPLVVMPHGGPHSCFGDTFVPENALLLNLGYGILRLNYVGSTGGTSDVTEMLCGKIGVTDVEDCQATVQSLLSQEQNLDPSKIVAHGGSHGGFLGAHLSSRYPDVYKAVSLRNPVTDLLPMISVSDITDWTYVECGVKDTSNAFIPVVKSLEDARKLMNCSPIQNVEKVNCPTLLLLGSEDLRVPISQGMAYYRALIAAGKIADVRIYNDCHPLGKVPCRFDAMLHTLLWFAKYLKK